MRGILSIFVQYFRVQRIHPETRRKINLRSDELNSGPFSRRLIFCWIDIINSIYSLNSCWEIRIDPLFALLTIGGSFIFCLYIFPRIFPYPDGKSIPKLAKPYIFRAISFADRRLYEQACIELERACDLGYCEDYDLKKREGVCQ